MVRAETFGLEYRASSRRLTQFKRMNAVYASVFKTPRPARVTVGVAALAVPTAHVEIMVIAQRQASKN